MPKSVLPPAGRSYIVQFDALRFFAAITIAVFHGELMKIIFQAPRGQRLYNWSSLGEHCVTLFFVLSGFLITWLLLKEKDRLGTIQLKAFYLRRVFRIWPLYYLTLVLGLYVVPFSDHIFLPGYVAAASRAMSGGEAVLWFTFFSNLYSAGLLSFQLLISHVWSIGTEEQFYGFWPWLMRKMARPQVGMAALVGVYLLLRFIGYSLFPSQPFSDMIEAFRFDCMAIGGLGAWYYHTQRNTEGTLLRIMTQPGMLYLAATASLVLTFVPDLLAPAYYTPLLSVVYAAMLLGLALQPQSMLWLTHPVLRYLGQISYGIYMYNILGCVLAINVIQRLGKGTFVLFEQYPSWANWLYYGLVVAITIGLSAISYRFVEAPFLRMKDRLAQPTVAVPA